MNPEENEVSEEKPVPNEIEISINYVQDSTMWNRNKTRVDDIFAYAIATDVINENDYVSKTLEECMHRNDWPRWQEAINAELNSLEKRHVFGPVVRTPIDVKPVGYKWVFAIKRNEKNEIVRYKARLVAQGFSQIPGVDYEETYSPVVDAITLRFLLGLTISEGLHMRLMDVVTAYLYGTLENDIYMKIPKGLKLPEALKSTPRDMCSIKLQRSLYGLKQSGRMWYNRLSEYLEKEGYKSDVISPCVFIKRSLSNFTIIAVYVDDINIIGSPEEIEKAAQLLKKEFEMKDLGMTKLVRYADAGYLSDPHKAKSQTGYVFTYGGTSISWKSTKQTLTTTSSNHAELIELYDAGRECVWLRSMINHIQEACGLEQIKKEPTIIYEDNTACIAQIREGYIKGDRTKHISPKFFSTYDLQKEGEIDVRQIKSSENLAELFTKSLPRSSFEQLHTRSVVVD
uniref:Putative reverse transcriptase, RNA-dependent DNA polymerase n=1 Tax=Helianthus annuus TaxID=4232 RepID=A0A251S8S4_HELAN